MNNRTKHFLGFLKKITNEKMALNGLLKADQNRAFAYYIAPLLNIFRIFKSGGIMPRANISGNIDVSSSIVQNFRNKKVFFSESRKTVDLHQCVNLFMNPINDTLFRFRRNALIQHPTQNPLFQIIGILEIDLESLLSEDGVDWEIFPENFVKAAKNELIDYENFAWSRIYTLTTDKDRNPNQAAEIILNNTRHQTIVPDKDITRVLVFNKDIPAGSDHLLDNPGFQIEKINNQKKYSALEDPLDYDRKFLRNLFNITENCTLCGSLINSLKRLKNIEHEIGLNLIRNYQNQDVAFRSMHGIGHTIRVMFWVLFLSNKLILDNSIPITVEDVTTSLYAAFIHDLCRYNNQVDNGHGSDAAQKFAPHLKKCLPQPHLDRCLHAVKIHSLPDDSHSPDIVWYLLKDADAIDRSRFGPPETENGCQKKYLRLKMLRKDSDFTDNVLWAAYFFARMTNYINWKDYSCSDFVVTLLGSLQALLNSPHTPSNHKDFANRIVQGMRNN